MHYVAGFMTFGDPARVLLVLKTKGPRVVVGTWNAIGGKVEDDETARFAIRREFAEETGIDLDWERHFARLDVDGHTVDFFHEHCAVEPRWRQIEAEPLAVFDVIDVIQSRMPVFTYNLSYLMSMAISARCVFADLRETV